MLYAYHLTPTAVLHRKSIYTMQQNLLIQHNKIYWYNTIKSTYTTQQTLTWNLKIKCAYTTQEILTWDMKIKKIKICTQIYGAKKFAKMRLSDSQMKKKLLWIVNRNGRQKLHILNLSYWAGRLKLYMLYYVIFLNQRMFCHLIYEISSLLFFIAAEFKTYNILLEIIASGAVVLICCLCLLFCVNITSSGASVLYLYYVNFRIYRVPL